MRISILFFAVFFVFTSCKNDSSSKSKMENSEATEESNKNSVIELVEVWSTPDTLMTAEAVAFDAKNGIYYVSCINGVPPTEKDGDGYIAILDQRGNIIDAKWIDGLDAPKGMTVRDGKLYVTNIDEFVVIDIESASIDKRIPVEGASFLNDVYAGAEGPVYFTDSNTNKIHMYDGDKVSLFVEDEKFGGPNGIYLDGNTFVVSGYGNGNVTTVNLDTKEVKIIGEGMIPSGDGVAKYKYGYFISNWN